MSISLTSHYNEYCDKLPRRTSLVAAQDDLDLAKVDA